MPDPHRISRELEVLLSRPEYTELIRRQNQLAEGKTVLTPQSIATQTADYLRNNHPLLDPVEVLPLRGRLEFYRTHDEGARPGSAQALGRSWIERSVFEQIWKGTERWKGSAREKAFIEFVRTANFVLPEWNDMTHIVCMTVPVGASIVATRGRGNWKAMKTPAGSARPSGAQSISTTADVMREGMMPMPGLTQCLIPLLEPFWLQPVDRRSAKWPFIG